MNRLPPQVFEALAHTLGQSVLFDEGVEATRNACVAGAPIAAAVVTAAAYYSNPLTGVPALLSCMERLRCSETRTASWLEAFAKSPHPSTGDPDYAPGFGFMRADQQRAIAEAAGRMLSELPGPRLALYVASRGILEAQLGPLNQAGLCAFVFVDQGLSADAAERTFVLLRMEPALVEAQRARLSGLKNFPFFTDTYRYEGPWPAPRSEADESDLDLRTLAQEVGLDL